MMRWIGRLSLLGSVLCTVAAAATASASIIVSSTGGARITILGADEVRDAYVRAEAGRPVLRLPNGESWELISETTDPEIANPGDGFFHPIDPKDVAEAVQAIDPAFIGAVGATIYVLPMPRRGLLDSSASDSVICLSPGVRALMPAQVHAVVTHEFGHVIQRSLLPDSAERMWSEYREIRGIADEGLFNAGAVHKNRPHEIFAEDFRFLFGGPKANASGSIENADLPLPDAVPGLRDWMVALVPPAAPVPATLAAVSFPDPFTSQTTVRWSSDARPGSAYSVRIFDPAGRLVRSLEKGTVPAGGAPQNTIWDGRDDAGRSVAAGVYFAVLSAGSLRASETMHLVR